MARPPLVVNTPDTKHVVKPSVGHLFANLLVNIHIRPEPSRGANAWFLRRNMFFWNEVNGYARNFPFVSAVLA